MTPSPGLHHLPGYRKKTFLRRCQIGDLVDVKYGVDTNISEMGRKHQGSDRRGDTANDGSVRAHCEHE